MQIAIYVTGYLLDVAGDDREGEDLENLARLYGATIGQLQAPPDEAELVLRMDRAQAILAKLSEEDLERWLAIGEGLARK